MSVVAEFQAPEGTITVTRESPTERHPYVMWAVDVPGLGRHWHSRKRDAMHHARAAIRLLTPKPAFDLVKALDRVREYGTTGEMFA